MTTNNSQMISPDGIVLLAKKPGLTSFTSLNSVKKALGTKKVGHTGTLDSFAQGLLVVCTGRLTKLAGNIIEFDKDYRAVIKFGEETDTLEYTGKVIRTAPLPSLEKLKAAITKYTGTLNQIPPVFSAIHVDGMRASDLMRSGVQVQIPSRQVTVYKAALLDYSLNQENKVEYCLIDFSVSKGTYIRSLARDIAAECGSAGHLTGLFRTKVGNFKIEDSAGVDELPAFTIAQSIIEKEAFFKEQQELQQLTDECKTKGIPVPRKPFTPDLELQEKIRNKMQPFYKETANNCGFYILTLQNENFKDDILHGRVLYKAMFNEPVYSFPDESLCAVYCREEFLGLIKKVRTGKMTYVFVIN